MKATAKNFFGTNLEQEVLDEVVLLPEGVYGVGTYNLAFDLSDFEFLLASGAISTDANMNNAVRVTSEIDVASLKQRAWLVGERTQTAGSGTGEITLSYLGERSVYVGLVSTGNAMLARFTKLVGYKRRISRVGIDELMSAMSLPNLIANADLTDNPINQRNFNGNWSSLAVGAYGYDQWMKVSATHMGYVIEAGKYRPSTKHTFTKDDVVIGEFMSPASGHWIVSVPFTTSGKFDLYAGQFKRPWHPIENALVKCARYFEQVYIDASGHAYSNGDCRGVVIPMLAPKRKPVSLSSVHINVFVTTSSGAGVNFGGSFENWAMFPTYMTPTALGNARNIAGAVGGGDGTVFAFSCRLNPLAVDASITLAEVAGQITTV
ncbi:TPA: hypothetical protein RI791_002056 [Vibrio cholerae]|nr:hypothetical protein [Vibrio cholerae]